MRCKDIFVLDVRIDVYVTLFLYASVVIIKTSILRLGRGMCALIGVIW
jgi:hypothetical protein